MADNFYEKLCHEQADEIAALKTRIAELDAQLISLAST